TLPRNAMLVIPGGLEVTFHRRQFVYLRCVSINKKRGNHVISFTFFQKIRLHLYCSFRKLSPMLVRSRPATCSFRLNEAVSRRIKRKKAQVVSRSSLRHDDSLGSLLGAGRRVEGEAYPRFR